MSGVNKVILVGNLGRDPEIRSLQNGGRVCNFSVATSESWKDKNSGARKERTEWHNVVIYNDGLVGVAEKYLRKGSKVYIEGQMSTRKWQDKDGNDRYTTEVVLQAFRGQLVLLDSRRDGDAAGDEEDTGSYGTAGTRAAPMAGAPRGRDADLDDDIPF